MPKQCLETLRLEMVPTVRKASVVTQYTQISDAIASAPHICSPKRNLMLCLVEVFGSMIQLFLTTNHQE